MTGWAQPSHPGGCSIFTGVVPDCHSPGEPALSQVGNVSLVLRLKSLWPIVRPHSCHKRESRSWIKKAAAAAVGCVMPIQETGPLPLYSVIDFELCCNKEQGRPTCVLLVSLQLLGRQCAWAVLRKSFLSLPLGSFPSFWDICHCGTARKKSGLLLLRFSLFSRSVL